MGTNANDIAHRTFSTGDFSKQQMVRTLSEAINIQVPYNFERLFYYLAHQDTGTVREWMNKMESSGSLQFGETLLDSLSHEIRSERFTDDHMLQVMQHMYKEHEYLLCPHSAIAVAAAQALQSASDQRRVVCLATAHPCRFEEAVCVGMGK